MAAKHFDSKIKHPSRRNILYRISQFVGFLLGARFFVASLLTFALYVSTFFLFNREESFRQFVFDFKVHGIIFCAVLSILAGGIINQFYDREKDQIIKPFRSRLQSFLKQNYFLYAYLGLTFVSLTIAALLSPRVLIFFLIYQFFMWFYSHKLSRILILNNLTFVALTLYPFFGMLVYYQTFSLSILYMALFLFVILLIIDILKDILTKHADRVFGYRTIPNFFGNKAARTVSVVLCFVLFLISMLIVNRNGLHSFMMYYFAVGLPIIALSIYFILSQGKKNIFYSMNLLRIWLFFGIISMLADGIINHFIR